MDYERLLSILDSGQQLPGQSRKTDRLMFAEANWEYDPLVCMGYLYDARHDSQPQLALDLSPAEDPLKIPAELRLLYPGSDETQSLRIELRPSAQCEAGLWQETSPLTGAEYPVGLYADLPDHAGNYSRWLICSRIPSGEGICCEAYRCNYRLQWAEEGTKSLWGVLNPGGGSRFSGIRQGELFAFPEEIREIWLPLNHSSLRLDYGRRLMVCAPGSSPLVFRVSARNDLDPAGLLKLSLVQDVFDPHTDRADPENGIFCADYRPADAEPSLTQGRIVCSGLAPVLKVRGGCRTLSAFFPDGSPADPSSWEASLDGKDARDLLEMRPGPDSQSLRVRFTGGETYLGRKIIFTVRDRAAQRSARLSLEVSSL